MITGDEGDTNDGMMQENRGEVELNCLFTFYSISDNDLICTKGVQSIATNISYQMIRRVAQASGRFS